MAEVYTYNGTHLTLVREAEFTQSAELGQVGSGRLALDDTDGTLAIVGQKNFSHTESACSVPLTFRGFIGPRSYGRNAGVDRAPDVGASRGIEVTLEDLNSMLGHRLLRGATAKRPAETVAARGAWLMGESATDPFADNGRCSFPAGKGMDKADYRNQYPGDVLADMALAAGGYNYHVNDWGSGPELTFRDDNASTADSSTLRISNVLSDASAVTLNPFTDATLQRDPSQVRSKIVLTYAKGNVMEERTATATTFNGERAGVVSNSNIKSEGKARDEAEDMLWQLSTEEDIINCTVEATSAQVNLILPGQRIQAKFSHLATEGYGSFTYFRILERTVKPIESDAVKYELTLKLSPQEAAQAVGAIVGSAFRNVGAGGGVLSLPNPVTIGNLLVYAVSDRVDPNPVQPNITTDQANWGTGAWTRFNGATITDVGTGDPKHGCAMYYKIADSANQTGFTHATDANIGIWELSGVTVTGATVAFADETTGTPYDLGTLGTAAVGTVALMVVEWDFWGALGVVVPAAGWTARHYGGAFPHWLGPHSPHAWFGDALGAGVALDPMVSTGVSREYAGVAVLLPAL